MRKSLLAIVLVGTANVCPAQDFVAPLEPAPREVEEQAAPQRAVSPLDPDSTVEGVVAAAFQMKEPWQLVNPMAAKGYGDGRYLTSWDPEDEGKPKGFIVFGIRFW